MAKVRKVGFFEKVDFVVSDQNTGCPKSPTEHLNWLWSLKFTFSQINRCLWNTLVAIRHKFRPNCKIYRCDLTEKLLPEVVVDLKVVLKNTHCWYRLSQWAVGWLPALLCCLFGKIYVLAVIWGYIWWSFGGLFDVEAPQRCVVCSADLDILTGAKIWLFFVLRDSEKSSRSCPIELLLKR